MTPSYEDGVKINVDAALNEEMRSAFCDVIVRDHEGMVLVGFSYLFTKAFDASLAEALALACTAQKAFKKGFSRVSQLCCTLLSTLADGWECCFGVQFGLSEFRPSVGVG
ncbi:hypothetical protein PVK06_028742 [Gossypium arboreum]|uniref:RNase H type-1 domain-containing protein n=1 Tax=Gossypium arboreum TaxID=29729 RepID=A0ABR0P4P5_GOSAR|nr:hypothetical protein PVK06_028742 [Gossypium arboreum]